MSANQLLQYVTEALFVLVFLVVAARAIRRPRRATIDTALLFGVIALIVAESWAAPLLHLTSNALVTAIVVSLLMALPYLLVRLVDDFSVVPIWLLRVAEIGLAAAVVLAFVLPPRRWPLGLTLLDIAYFVALAVYSSGGFIRAAHRASGVTMRRMQAVAAGSLCLGLAIVVDGVQAARPAEAGLWSIVSGIFALATGLGYYVGFAPPRWMRRAWQEPEVRAFLGRAARLPRLPDTRAIVRELERGATDSLGALGASICLWDEAAQVLRAEADGVRYEAPAGAMIAGRVFASQQPLFWPDAAHSDPAHAALYRSHTARALLGAPISAGEKQLGALIVYAARPSIFADDDLVLVQLLADQAAVILESRALIDEAAAVRAREEAARLKDDFLSAAAHDLKTPLTALLAQAQLLERRARRDPTAPPDLPGLQRMVAETQRLKRFVLDLLDVARVEQGQLVGAREPVDLATLAIEVCERHDSDHHHCLAETDGPLIGAYDANRIAQLLENLIDNAVKYSPEGGDIRVTVRREGDEAHLTVADGGIGIPAADLPHLFGRFHRGTNVDDRRFAGLGLGLYICHGIATQHGGRIWASSPGPGRGSTFYVVLPDLDPVAAASPTVGVLGGVGIAAGDEV